MQHPPLRRNARTAIEIVHVGATSQEKDDPDLLWLGKPQAGKRLISRAIVAETLTRSGGGENETL